MVMPSAARPLASNPDYGLVSEPSTYGESLSVAAVSNGVVNSPYVTVGGRTWPIGQRHHQRRRERQALPQPVLPGLHRVCGGSQLRRRGDYAGLDPQRQDRPGQRGGGMYYEQKERAAANAGAIGMLVYNNVPGMLYMSITDRKIPCAFISQAAGEYMKQQETKTLSVASADALVESPTYGMADFSSWGAPPS